MPAASLERTYALVERTIGRKLSEAERAVDVLKLDAALNVAKDELDAAISDEMLRAAKAWVRLNRIGTPQLELTKAIRRPLERLHDLGREEAAAELERLGYGELTPAKRAFAAPDPFPGGGFESLLNTIRRGLLGIGIRIEHELVVADLTGASSQAVAHALMRVPGARDLASRVVSTALTSGMALTFEEHADLVPCWEYSSLLDGHTCERCRPLDGREYHSLEELFQDLPGFGPNPRCLGGGRCRCRAVPCPPDEDFGLIDVPEPDPGSTLNGLMICRSLCKSRAGYTQGLELKGKKWEPVGAGEGRIERIEKDGRVLLNAGTSTRPRWIVVQPDAIVPAARKVAPYRVGAKAKSGLNDDFADFGQSLSAAERAAFDTYQGPAYKAINTALRKGKRTRYQSAVARMDEAIERAEIKEATKVYRGVRSRRQVFGTDDLESLIGKEWSELAFTSATTTQNVAFEFAGQGGGKGAVVEILLPKGAKGGWLRAILMGRDLKHKWGGGLTTTEDELILPRGMRFRIAGVKRSKVGSPTIIMEAIG